MRRIVYISTASALAGDDVGRILESAIRGNGLTDISGFLLYNGRNFLQLIEGQQAALMSLMGKLARDPRHSGILVLVDEAIEQRCCPDWRMHLLRLSDDVARRRSLLAEQLPPCLADYPRQLVQNFAALN